MCKSNWKWKGNPKRVASFLLGLTNFKTLTIIKLTLTINMVNNKTVKRGKVL